MANGYNAVRTEPAYQAQIRTLYYGPSKGPWRVVGEYPNRAEAAAAASEAGMVNGMVDAREHNSYSHDRRVVRDGSSNWIES